MSRNVQPQRSNLYKALLPTALIFGALIIVAIFITWLTNISQAEVTSTQTGELNADVMQRFETQYDKLGMAIGDPDAPVTIREFADYQCPACRAFAPTAAKVRDQLVASGKVRFVYFDFPLAMHEHSVEAAIAARCAARQDKYWAYQEALFANQKEWAPTQDPISSFLDIAVENGLNAQQLKQCIIHDSTRDAVEQSRALAKKIGIRVTPTIMVGSKVISGVADYDRIKTLVQAQIRDSASE